ncbi:arachidonate 15-lipoxygenase [Parasphingorhabdus halotolerans]|uniref:Arachidonate 15-lipoxygenase n=2 Tax=Parasphingorhabdus halotolerans TaxID=2725558 RepID=A0A6H2DS85_9SPHN|nr:arachidonate 15-lipoxygenase [Parasphingorhabdus halotolerans]
MYSPPSSAATTVKRGASHPSLPQNDSPEQKTEREQQISNTCEQYQWTTEVEALPGVPLAKAMPSDDDPSIAWWLDVLHVGLDIIKNIAAVYTQPIFSGLSAAEKEIIDQALHVAQEVSNAVDAIRLKHTLSKDITDLEAEVHQAEQQSDIDQLKQHDNEIRDIIDIIMDILKAVETADTRSIEAYRNLYQTTPVPAIAYNFQDDDLFARLRIAGPNPMLIKGIDAVPDNFPVSAEQYAAAIAGDDLTTALADGRVYLLDYAELEILAAGVWKGQAKYVYQPMALFAVPPGGSSLKPVAIQCGQDNNQYPVVTPTTASSGKWGWELAKFVVQVADCNYHELFVHLADTHLVSEAIAVATRRNLANKHPLWSLLVPHFEGTLFINNLATQTLINKGGPIDAFFGGTITSSQMAAVKARLSFDFYDKMLHNDMAKRAVGDSTKLPDFPYRDDARLVWDAIHDWAQQYINVYYADDDAITGDTELADWAKSIACEGHVAGFTAITSREQLVDVCTMIIFTASAQHAAVNFPQKSLMAFAPAITGGGWTAAPTEQQGHDKQEWLNYMPPMSLALVQQSSLILLGSVYYRPLGEYQTNRFPYQQWFRDAVITESEGPLARFQAGLRAVEARIIARNKQRMHPYTYLQPSLIPTSTNI